MPREEYSKEILNSSISKRYSEAVKIKALKYYNCKDWQQSL